MTLIVPCPYTGQKMKLTISVNVSRADMNVAASASPMLAGPKPMTIPSPANAAAANAAYRPIPTPVVMPAAPGPRAPAPSPAGIPIPAPRKMTPASGAHPLPQQPVIMGLDSLDELTPMEPAMVPATVPAPRAIPAPRQVAAPVPRPMPAPVRSAPLPDVPILPNQAPAPSAPMQFNANSAPMPVDLLSAPMDLSAFEAKVSASGIMRAVQMPAEPQDAAAGSGVDALPDDDGSLCSVSIGKSNSPKVHQLVAELQGLSIAESARLCQKPIVTLAKDITVGEARSIKQQFAAVNVVAKITRRS